MVAVFLPALLENSTTDRVKFRILTDPMQLTARPPSPISDPALPVTAAPASPAAAAAVVAIATVVELAEEGRGAEAKGEDGAGRPRSPTSESVQRSESTARCEAAVPNAACRCACGLSAELTRNQRKRRQHCIWWAARPSARGRPHLVVHHTCSTPRLLYTTLALHHACSTPTCSTAHLLYTTLLCTTLRGLRPGLLYRHSSRAVAPFRVTRAL